MSAGFTRETIKIPSVDKDVYLDVWLFKPTTSAAPFPVVIAGHGMTVIKEAGMAPFGQKWATEAGYASLVFDYRYFGDSGGEPRNLLSMDKQLEDYKSVLKYARQNTDLFLNDKIVIMGTAMSGLNVTRLALEDTGLAGAMSQSPMLDAYAAVTSLPFNPRLIFWAIVDAIKGKLGLSPVFIHAIGRPKEFCMVNSPSSVPGFQSMYAQGTAKFEDYPNKITPRLVFDLLALRPALKMSEIHCPFLIVYGKDDDVLAPQIAIDAERRAPEKVTLVEVPGGHFDIMEGGTEGFVVNIRAQIKFLRDLL